MGYVFGYLFPLLMEGIPNNMYLIPIKLTGVICAIGLGTPLYYGNIQVPIFLAVWRMTKYMILIVVLMILTILLESLLYNNYGFDISPFIGFPK